MAGTSVPYLLYPTGSPPVVITGGTRSLFAFWMGGASAVPYTPPPPVDHLIDPGAGDKHRRRRRERDALREAIERADRIVRGIKPKDGLQAEVVQVALEAIEDADSSISPEKIAAIADAAKSLAAIRQTTANLEQAQQAIAHVAQQMHLRWLRELEDEEEAVLLLMH